MWLDALLRSAPAIITGHGTDNDDEDDDDEEDTVLMEASERNLKRQQDKVMKECKEEEQVINKTKTELFEVNNGHTQCEKDISEVNNCPSNIKLKGHSRMRITQ